MSVVIGNENDDFVFSVRMMSTVRKPTDIPYSIDLRYMKSQAENTTIKNPYRFFKGWKIVDDTRTEIARHNLGYWIERAAQLFVDKIPEHLYRTFDGRVIR